MSIHYTASLSDGTVFCSSRGKEPFSFVYGAGRVFPGLERAIHGFSPGNHIKINNVTPDQGFGPRQEYARRKISKDQIPKDTDVRVGEQLAVQGPNGVIPLTIAALNEHSVVIDCNHPLAGRSLCFSVDVLAVRDGPDANAEPQHVSVHSLAELYSPTLETLRSEKTPGKKSLIALRNSDFVHYFANNSLLPYRIVNANARTEGFSAIATQKLAALGYVGLVLIIDKNSIVFNRLQELKALIYRCHTEQFRIAVAGIPYCTLQRAFGGLEYTKSSSVCKEVFSAFFTYHKEIMKGSHLTLACRYCIARDTCTGLDSLSRNDSIEGYRITPEKKYREKRKISFEDDLVRASYTRFLERVRLNSCWKTERTLKYANVLSEKEAHRYEQRFIYYARYLDLDEIGPEYEALRAMVLNEAPLHDIFGVYYPAQKCSGFAYTLAKKGRAYRETFYAYFVSTESLNQYLGKNFKFSVENGAFEFNYFSGIDYVGGKAREFKVYSSIHDAHAFRDYIRERYNIYVPSLLFVDVRHLTFVKRFSLQGVLLSVKIELTPTHQREAEAILSKMFLKNLSPPNQYFMNTYYALEFSLDGGLEKLTTYMTNKM